MGNKKKNQLPVFNISSAMLSFVFIDGSLGRFHLDVENIYSMFLEITVISYLRTHMT